MQVDFICHQDCKKSDGDTCGGRAENHVCKELVFFCFFVHSMYKNLQSFVPSSGRMRCICVKMSKLAVRIISFGDRKYGAFFIVSLLKLDAHAQNLTHLS